MTYYSLASAPIESAGFKWLHEPENMYGWSISAGVPVKDLTRLPTAARQKNTRPLYDFMPVPGLHMVSGAFRQAVEEFEPGQHQFFPVALQKMDGSPHDGTWFILNICGRIPCLIPKEPLKYGWGAPERGAGELSGGYQEPYYSSLDHRECMVSKPAAGNRHLWGSWVFRRPKWICSEPLFLRLKELCRGGRASGENWDILGLEINPIDETDEPWKASIHAPVWYDWAMAHPEEVERLGYGKFL